MFYEVFRIFDVIGLESNKTAQLIIIYLTAILSIIKYHILY